jgi:hypothetical protein
MKEYKLDRTVFKMMTFKEADRRNVFDKNVSYSQRLEEAYYLILKAYGFSMDSQPRLDRTYFSSRKQS